jgi:hypothetical protein
MRRRLAMLLSATLVAGIAAVLVQASPASAGVHVCAGTGQANLGIGLTYPVTVTTDLPPHPLHVLVIQQPRTTTFTFSLFFGGCVNTNPPNVKSPTLGTTVTADGVVSGWCGLSSGTGTLHLGTSPRFAWVGVGEFLVVTGGVTGVLHAPPDTLAGHSCNNNAGASQILVTGLVVANDHCAVKNKGLTSINIPPGVLQTTLISPLGIPFALVSIHATGTWHVWTKACVPIPLL